jgi:hypothetical protein
MKITRPQPEARSTTRRLKWWQVLKRLNRWEADRDYNRIEKALERHQNSMWANGLQCLECRTVVTQNAKYCHVCGADLYPTTEPIIPVMPTTKVLHPPTPGLYARFYNHVPGGTHTKTIKAVNLVEMAELQATGKLQLAELQRKMQEREDMRKKEGQH